MPLQITWRDIPKSEAVEADIENKAHKLEQFCDSILGCRVLVESSYNRHHHGNLYRIRIDIDVPENEIVVTRDPDKNHAHEDIYVTVRDAFDAARRQLQDYVRVRRGQVKQHDSPHSAQVKFINPQEDYGFLQTADGREIFFHRNALINVDFNKLEKGLEVNYLEEEGREGPQAKQVSVRKRPKS